MAATGSNAATVHPDNAVHFAALLANSTRGGVHAGMRAAEAVEGTMEGTRFPPAVSDEDEEEDPGKALPRAAVPRTPGGVRAHRAAVEAQTARQAGRIGKQKRD